MKKTKFKKANFVSAPKSDVKYSYISFYEDAFKGSGIKVFFDNVSYSNGMSVYVSFVKEGSEMLQVRHSDHANGIGSDVVRCAFDIKVNADLHPSAHTVQRVKDILNKYTTVDTGRKTFYKKS